jgi:hypothetical protein
MLLKISYKLHRFRWKPVILNLFQRYGKNLAAGRWCRLRSPQYRLSVRGWNPKQLLAVLTIAHILDPTYHSSSSRFCR